MYFGAVPGVVRVAVDESALEELEAALAWAGLVPGGERPTSDVNRHSRFVFHTKYLGLSFP